MREPWDPSLTVLTDEHVQQKRRVHMPASLGSTWLGPSGVVHLVNFMLPLPTASQAWQRHCRARHMQPCSRSPGACCLPRKGEPQAAILVSSLASYCVSFLHKTLTQSTRDLTKDVAMHLSSDCILYMSEFFFWLDFSYLGSSFLPSFLPTFRKAVVLKGTVIISISCFYRTLPSLQRFALLLSPVVLIISL